MFKSLFGWCCGRRDKPLKVSAPIENPKLRPASVAPPRPAPERPDTFMLTSLSPTPSWEMHVEDALRAIGTSPRPDHPDVPRSAASSHGSEYSHSTNSSHYSSWYAP